MNEATPRPPSDGAVQTPAAARPRRRLFRRVRLFVIVVLFVAISLELLLQVLSFIPQIEAVLGDHRIEPTVEDAGLGFRRNPALPDYDERGYRNPSVPETTDVITLGDSQTEGCAVSREHAWPTVLGQMLDRPLYNMASGGYDPSQYAVQIDEALQFKPKVVVVAVYAGNDLVTMWQSVWRANRAAFLRTPLTEDPAADAESVKADRIEVVVTRKLRHRGFWHGLGEFIKSNSKIYGLGRAVDRGLLQRRQGDMPNQRWSDMMEVANRVGPDVMMPVEVEGSGRTMLLPSYRLVGVDPADPRVPESIRLIMASLRHIRDRIGQTARMQVVLIPTKETVLAPWVQNPESHPVYQQVLAGEAAAMSEIRAQLEADEIPAVSVLDALRAAVTAGNFPYRNNDDGHPNKHGNRAMAEAVRPVIQALLENGN